MDCLQDIKISRRHFYAKAIYSWGEASITDGKEYRSQGRNNGLQRSLPKDWVLLGTLSAIGYGGNTDTLKTLIHTNTRINYLLTELTHLQTTQMFRWLTYKPDAACLVNYPQEKCTQIWKHTPTNKCASPFRERYITEPSQRACEPRA